MHNIWLIARREYLERIRTKAFIIATILIPALLGGLGFGAGYLAQRTKSNAHIAILSSDPTFAGDLKHELEQGKDSDMRVDVAPLDNGSRARFSGLLKDAGNRFAGYLQVFPPAAPGDRPRFVYTSRSASDITTVEELRQSIKTVLTREHLAGKGIDTPEIAGLLAPVVVETPATGDTQAAFFGAYLLFILMYMVIMLYSMNTARSIIEEKIEPHL